jgi:hypothetical protein
MMLDKKRLMPRHFAALKAARPAFLAVARDLDRLDDDIARPILTAYSQAEKRLIVLPRKFLPNIRRRKRWIGTVGESN